MKAVAALLLGIALASALPFNEKDDDSDVDGWFVPQLDGSLKWMTQEEAQELAQQHILSGRRTAPSVSYYLYTPSNPSTPQLIDINNVSSLQNSHFNKVYPTRIIIHGWQNNHLSDINVVVRTTLLKTGKYNVICVDWSSKSESLNYAASAGNVPRIGKQVAEFIEFLHNRGGLTFSTLNLIGHSLGAHVSGFAGKNLKTGKIQTIVGLDPALPLFKYNKPSERLHLSDANYVESIQTCGGLLGFMKPIGKGAFYLNGGKSQPGCGIDLSGSCSHSRSYEYYAEALMKNNFPSIKCDTYKAAKDKSCGNKYSSVRMGSPTNDQNALGEYYVPVNKKSPFGKMTEVNILT